MQLMSCRSLSSNSNHSDFDFDFDGDEAVAMSSAMEAVESAWADLEAVFSDDDSPPMHPAIPSQSMVSGEGSVPGAGMEAVDSAWAQYTGAILDEVLLSRSRLSNSYAGETRRA